MSEILELLNRQAHEIASAGIPGWGNTMTLAAEEIRQLERRCARLEELLRAAGREGLLHQGGILHDTEKD